jgi:hypothetical protein
MRPVPATAFPFAHRARDPGVKGIALRVFGPPNFPRAVGNKLFLKIGSPEKVASEPDPLTLVAPRCAQHHARKAVAAPFRTAAPGVLFEASRETRCLMRLLAERTQP